MAAIIGFGGATLVKNGVEKPQVDRGPDITISDVVVNSTFDSVSIYWTTNIQTNGKIEYGQTDSYGQEMKVGETNPWPFAYHRLILYRWQLSPLDSFHFRIIVTDPKTGKEVKSGDYAVGFYKRAVAGECKTTVRVPEDYLQIQTAIAAACLNGTVMVSPGTYREEIRIYNGVNLIGASPSNTKIISPAATGPTIVVTAGKVAYEGYLPPRDIAIKASTISGFTISSDYLDMSAPPPPVFERGPFALAASDNPYKAGSSLGSIGLIFGDGTLEAVSHAIIKNNIFLHNDTGIILGPYVMVENNTFVGERGSDYGILAGMSDPQNNLSFPVIQNNVIVDYETVGVRIGCWPADLCKSWVDESKLLLRYNNVWHNKHDYYFETLEYRGGSNMPISPYAHGAYFSPLWQQPVFLTGKEADQTGKNGNISADPLFVNADASDFHERTGSPHVDAGNPKSDFSLEPQPNGGRINIGAYGNTAEATQSR